ncbi:MAG: hypothetical protein COB24_00915 [Hyphomicrobiales bacterium]|nr:MAG: hypothetical protein COB24_00915 [Hyphomicrobiales bacterium]
MVFLRRIPHNTPKPQHTQTTTTQTTTTQTTTTQHHPTKQQTPNSRLPLTSKQRAIPRARVRPFEAAAI